MPGSVSVLTSMLAAEDSLLIGLFFGAFFFFGFRFSGSVLRGQSEE
jgi:hypothetical protein